MPPHDPAPRPDGPARADRRSFLLNAGALSAAALAGGCGGHVAADAPVDANPSTPAPAAGPRPAAFTHPGLLHTEADLARMAQKVASGAEPWLGGWNALLASDYTSLGGVPNPQAVIVRGDTTATVGGVVYGQNFATMVYDMQRSYMLALRWKGSGDTRYADLAVKFLDAWSGTMTTLTGNADRFIAAGLYGYQWANTAEILRSYPGWSPAGIARFQTWLLELYYPLSRDFLLNHNGADITNYWASWDMLTLCGVLAIGVFCDRRDLYDEALAYFKTGRGNGAAAHVVYRRHPGHLGQWMESGRDQGHSTLSVSCAASLCEMAWNQGDDLYGHDNNRILSGAEYVAASNLADANGNFPVLPFSPYVNRQGTMTSVSNAGRPHLRPAWETLYHHYVNRQGLSAPYVAAMAAALRPESRGGGDDPSFGTLTHSREPIATGAAPSGLTAHLVGGAVELSWWGSAHATGYEVQRSTGASGPWSALATTDESRTHTDTAPATTWFYRVVALTATGRLAGADVRRVVVGTELRMQLPLDEGSGTAARDATGTHAASTLAGGAGWGVGRKGGSALALDGTSGHVVMPPGLMKDLADFTISVWVYRNRVASGNTRIFDIGSSDIAYLTLLVGASTMRFCTTGTTYWGEESAVAAAGLATGRWVHLAVTRAGNAVTLYVDGAVSGTHAHAELAPHQLGDTRQNWLGRAQYGADPYFDGRLQDFRLYSGALDAAQVAALAAA
jgi:hypothetical protein